MRAIGCALVIAAAALAGCGDGAGEESSTLVTGSLLELTGPLSTSGPAWDKAGKLATEQANAAAKEAGVEMRVKHVSADAQGDPQAALQAARSLVGKDASCLVGPATTPEATAVAQGLTIAKRLLLWPQGTSTKLTTLADRDTVFRTSSPDNLQARALAGAAEKRLGGAAGKTVSVAYRNEPYGEGLAKDFGAAWKAAGGRVQGPVVFDPNQGSYDSEADRIVGGSPDGFLIIDYPDTYAKMGASLLRTGRFDASKAFVPDTLSLSEIPKDLPPKALEGATGTRAGSPESSAAFSEFDRLWKAAGGAPHFSLDANTFDAHVLCFLAAVAAKSSDPEAIQGKVRAVAGPPGRKLSFGELADAVKAADAGQEIDYEGVSGPVNLDGRGDPTTGLYDLFTYEGGKLRVSEQIDVAR